LVPDQPPEAVQAVALLAAQVSVELLPLVTVLGLALSVIVGAAAEMDMVVDCEAVPPAPVQVNPYVAVAFSAPVDCVPLSAWAPAHAPEAVHAVAFVAVHANVELAPLATVVGLADRLTVGASAATDTVADCVALPPAPVQVST
jgi:hypothetical protein